MDEELSTVIWDAASRAAERYREPTSNMTDECPAWFNRRHQYNYGSAIDYPNDCIVRYCKCGATRQEPRF